MSKSKIITKKRIFRFRADFSTRRLGSGRKVRIGRYYKYTRLPTAQLEFRGPGVPNINTYPIYAGHKKIIFRVTEDHNPLQSSKLNYLPDSVKCGRVNNGTCGGGPFMGTLPLLSIAFVSDFCATD